MADEPAHKPIQSYGPDATYSGVRRVSQVPVAQEITQRVDISQLAPPQAQRPARRATNWTWWVALTFFGFVLGGFLAQRILPLLLQ